MVSEIEQFINWVRIRSPQARTWRDYKCDLELFRAVMGNRDVEEIHPKDVDGFVNYQVQRAGLQTKYGQSQISRSSFLLPVHDHTGSEGDMSGAGETPLSARAAATAATRQ